MGASSSLQPDYAGLTLDTCAAGQRAQAQRIIDNLHLAYLSITDEPDTFATNLDLPLDSARPPSGS